MRETPVVRKTLNPKTQQLLDELIEDAKSHGCLEEYGCGPSVNKAQKNFENSREALVQHILMLENRIRRQRLALHLRV